jgi:hypothetical protein
MLGEWCELCLSVPMGGWVGVRRVMPRWRWGAYHVAGHVCCVLFACGGARVCVSIFLSLCLALQSSLACWVPHMIMQDHHDVFFINSALTVRNGSVIDLRNSTLTLINSTLTLEGGSHVSHRRSLT